MTWQPIDTAPKNGMLILACIDGKWAEVWDAWRGPCTVSWRTFHPNAPGRKTWRREDGRPISPTHWMPLPPPPTTKESESCGT